MASLGCTTASRSGQAATVESLTLDQDGITDRQLTAQQSTRAMAKPVLQVHGIIDSGDAVSNRALRLAQVSAF